MGKIRLLLIDFYDSFTYNIVHYIESLGPSVDVVFFDQVNINDINHYHAIILSPGPGLPNQKMNMNNLLNSIVESSIPVLGICLGFQALAEFLGFELENQRTVKHGVSEELTVYRKNSILYRDMPLKFNVGLYHSWSVKNPPNLLEIITSKSKSGVLMSIEDENEKIFGVQFHPESILTENGIKIFENFLHFVKEKENI